MKEHFWREEVCGCHTSSLQKCDACGVVYGAQRTKQHQVMPEADVKKHLKLTFKSTLR